MSRTTPAASAYRPRPGIAEKTVAHVPRNASGACPGDAPARSGIDRRIEAPRMNGMKSTDTVSSGTSPEVLDDLAAVLRHVAAGTAVEPALARRIEERSERLTEALRQRYGELEVAVDLIREI